MCRWLVILGFAASMVATAPAGAVIDGRGSVAVAGSWTPAWPHASEIDYAVTLAATNEPVSELPVCPAVIGCLSGFVHVASTGGWTYRAQVTCMWVQDPHVYLSVLGGSGDSIVAGAAYVSSGVFDAGGPDAFALLEDRAFDCHDEEVRRVLRESARAIRPGAALVIAHCPAILVCPD